jgi:predicted metal-dependent enzyme (double-stranded beta helix superfamily)
MFGNLFVRSDALARQVSAPLVDERRRYLVHCAEQGMLTGVNK